MAAFITVIIQFLILAWIIFLMVKGINSLRAKEEAKPSASCRPPADIALLTEIRDLLKTRA